MDISDQLSEREQHLQALHEIAVASSGLLDPDELGRLVIERARDLLGGDEATLLWFDPAAGGLRILGDTYIHPFPRIIAPGEGSAGLAFNRGEPVVVEDYQNWDHAVRDSLTRGMRSVIAVPLLVASRPVGVLTISFNTPKTFKTEDLRLLSLLATQVAPALEAARLHDALLLVSQELEHAVQVKSRFLASMSHELRTPLGAILGFSELLIDDKDGKFSATQKEGFLEQIHSSGAHLLGLINDILDLSKIEAGEMELHPETIKVGSFIAEVIDTTGPLASKKQIKVWVDAADAGWIEVDGRKLKQMLLNLLSNAIKFTPDGGRISITANAMDGFVKIAVADTGIGIAKSDLGELFKEFKQLDSGGSRPQGTGLGLALTRRFAQLHGGDVSVESEIGKGSVFTIRLPARQPSVAKPAIATTGADSGVGPLILIVEDNPASIELIKTILDKGGFRTEVAVTGPEALRKARELRPAAITLDIILPQLDGWDVLARLKHDEATSGIPVIVISAIDKPELGMALGAFDYFVKPIRPAELLNRLARFRRVDGSEIRDVLVVDDEPANREVLAGILEPAGFSVRQATGGREGIQIAKSNHPDLVLLDLMMPEVTGFDVVEALRADPSTRETPIMVITAKDLTDSDKRQLNGQVSAILSRGSTAAADLLGHLNQIVAPGAGRAGS